ncbi:hypothetical protein [Candidatus Amarolinea dominans]|uniref:hypothetical protein n=1 Tax=Candidatus Amarolinea dominans TaxID=3140696 RepID=UPI003134AB6A|nr:hypothetical protein [Anaerolineae bacterium]
MTLRFTGSDIYREGLSHALIEPEFARLADMIRRAVEIIEALSLLEYCSQDT